MPALPFTLVVLLAELVGSLGYSITVDDTDPRYDFLSFFTAYQWDGLPACRNSIANGLRLSVLLLGFATAE
jgi:hypothetical protein